MDGAGQQHYLAGHDRLEALVHQLDADSPLVLDEDANDSLAGEKGHAARGQVRTGISVYRAASPLKITGTQLLDVPYRGPALAYPDVRHVPALDIAGFRQALA